MTSGIPPERLTFFSLAPAQKPTNWESGDQNGNSAPSLWAIGCASDELKALSHSELWPDASVAAKASICPSGESAICSNGCQLRSNVTPSGNPSDKRTA